MVKKYLKNFHIFLITHREYAEIEIHDGFLSLQQDSAANLAHFIGQKLFKVFLYTIEHCQMSVSFPKLNIPTVISKNLQLLSFLSPYFSNLFWGLMFLTHCADVSYVLIFGMVKVLAPSFLPKAFKIVSR